MSTSSALPGEVDLAVPRFQQPDDVSCGTTCLRQVYAALGRPLAFEEIDVAVRRNEDGGTYAMWLGLAALSHGFAATLYPFGLRVFDPTWADLGRSALLDKVESRAATRKSTSERDYVRGYAEFLRAGGDIRFDELSRPLLCARLHAGHPLVCGLSATWLYRHPRQDSGDNEFDDVGGEPVGHFVVVGGYRRGGEVFDVCDPASDAPYSADGRYLATSRRLMQAILLGDATRDAHLLELAHPLAEERRRQST